MSTGTSRLTDMHKGKRKKMPRVTVEDIVKIDAETSKEAVYPTHGKVINFTEQPKEKKRSLTKKELTALGLKTEDKKFYPAIYEHIKAIYPDNPEKYTLAAATLAKLYAQQERIENEIEATGGYVLEDNNGKMYANPAVTMLQKLQNTILANLRAIGLTVRGQEQKQPEKEDTAESEFAQFK